MMEQFSMDADSRPDSPIILAQSPPGKEDTLSIQVCLLVPYWWTVLYGCRQPTR